MTEYQLFTTPTAPTLPGGTVEEGNGINVDVSGSVSTLSIDVTEIDSSYRRGFWEATIGRRVVELW